jgi:glycosyltransferase involved in cell wall biosynthesis
MTPLGPLVSILTPSLDQGAWLADNLRSVACQTYPNIEHVVMDGGSADGSLAILENADSPVVWRSEPDEGQSDAVNKAFAASHGEIVGWINSDDAYFDCRVVSDVVAFFDRHPEVDVVYGHCAQVDDTGEIIWMIWVPRFMPRALHVTNFIGQPVAFMRRHVLTEPMLDPSFHFAMDYDLWLRLDAQGARFARIDRIVAVDRYHPGRKSETIPEVHRQDLDRLTKDGRRADPFGKRLLSWVFYTWRRAMGSMLVDLIPDELAFTDVRTDRAALYRRQVYMWNRSWPADWKPSRD